MRLLLYISFIMMLVSCSTQELEKQLVKDIEVTLSCNVCSYVAGDTVILTILLSGVEVDSIELDLLFTHSHGELLSSHSLIEGENRITVPAVISQKRGKVLGQVLGNGKILDRVTFDIEPRDPYDLVESYSGPATIESSGIDWHLITAIAKDEFDNPVADGTEMEFNIRYPNGSIRRVKRDMEKLLNGVRIDAVTKAGKIFTGVKSGTAHSMEREVLVTPTWPERFNLEIVNFLPFAEQRQVLRLRTSIIKDRYNNTIADATAVQFEVKDDLGSISKFISYTVSGRAEVQIENPEKATNWKVQAYVDQSKSSNTLNLRFNESVIDIPIEYSDDESMLIFGPILGPLDQFVANGVILSFEIKATSSNEWKSYQAEVFEGYYHWNIPKKIFQSGAYDCRAFIGDSQSAFSFNYLSEKENYDRRE